MSVYRATASPVAPDTPPPTPDAPEERDVEEDVSPVVVSGTPAEAASLERPSPRRSEDEEATRRPAIHDGRPVSGRVRTEKRIVQLRSAQKVSIVPLSASSDADVSNGRISKSH